MKDTSLAAAPIFNFPRRWRPVSSIARRLFALDRLQEIYAGLPPDRHGAEFIDHLLDTLALGVDDDPAERARIPAKGGLLVVANHPSGAAEGLLLARRLLQVRPDVRILANHLLNRIPQLRELLIPVDPFGGAKAVANNRLPMLRALRWLKSGGVLVVFPAGEVSHLRLSSPGISDPPWTPDLAVLVRRSGAKVLPVWFGGGNGPAFQVAGLVHPRLRTALLPRELLNKRRRRLPMRIGRVIPAGKLSAFADDAELMAYLRLRTYLLGRRSRTRKAWNRISTGRQHPVAPAQTPERLASEVAALGPERRLATSGDLDVHLAEPWQIPYLLLEIGRLRELTFRGAGEGTGRELDIDAFDAYYSHLFLWHRTRREVVGAYRIGRIDPAPNCRPDRFYTHTLFQYGPEFFRRLGPALELGRSFVRSEYQRQFSPLMLLWKGIGTFVSRHPRYRMLFGPVSISRDYSRLSKNLLTGALQKTCFLPDLARLVRPRTPIRLQGPAVPGVDRRLLQALGGDLKEVVEWIADLDPQPGGIPVLLRQYLGLGGRVLAFNQDRDFSDVVDALIVVDLARTEERVLARYLGREAARRFFRYHETETLEECA